jgi:pimeloyl-ACP methyl ester carboxylesterase
MCKQCLDPDVWFSTQDPRARPEPDWGSAIQLRLQRHVPPGAADSEARRRPAVLLLHGGSANHRTFTIKDGLADWLLKEGFDPWLLDWRGSSLVSDCLQNDRTLKHESELYTFNRAAREDVPAALAIMRSDSRVAEGPIALVGHCMGAAVIAEAVACGWTRGAVDRIVLLALGLFYEAAIDSRVKAEERVLERLTREVADHPCIDPRVKADGELLHPWPQDLDKLYDAWPGGLRAHHHEQQPVTVVENMCNRITFMYGMPYREDNLAAGIHDAELPKHFGGFPLQMYLHAARNLRERQATSFDPTGPQIVSDETRQRFRQLTSVTLITGELNRLWHRDSIDRMHEWLCRGDSTVLQRIKKHVLPNYAHQDLLWGAKSSSEVYPHIAIGLGQNNDPSDGATPPHHPIVTSTL